MNKYKVEINRTEDYIVDVFAKDEEEARQKATEEFASIKLSGLEYRYQIGDTVEETRSVFDVTNTDDPFNL